MLAAVLLWGIAGAPRAGEARGTCRLALVLAIDVSSSVNAREYALQRDGLAAALDSADVRHAVLRGGPGDVMLAAYEWSGRYRQVTALDWTRLDSDTAIDRAVGILAGTTRSERDYPTAMGYALGFGGNLLAPMRHCARRVLDMSGDGITNEGFGPRLAYRYFPFDGVTVNGLVVTGEDAKVETYYRKQVLHGAGAFLERATGYDDFFRAMRRKLYREVNDIVLGVSQPFATLAIR